MTAHSIAKARLGRTGLSVTNICFGTSSLGDMPDTYGYGVDAERAKATVRRIFAGPANVIDTSRNYGFGRSEERIGAVIREDGGLPDGFVLSTKLDRDAAGRFDFGEQMPREYVIGASMPGALGAIVRIDLRKPSAPRDISKSRNSPLLPHSIEMCRIDPSRSKPRSVDIFSRPGQSSCLSITQAGLSLTMRRITPGVICTENVSG